MTTIIIDESEFDRYMRTRSRINMALPDTQLEDNIPTCCWRQKMLIKDKEYFCKICGATTIQNKKKQ